MHQLDEKQNLSQNPYHQQLETLHATHSHDTPISPKYKKTDLASTKSVHSAFNLLPKHQPTQYPFLLILVSSRREKTDLTFAKSVYSVFGSGGWI